MNVPRLSIITLLLIVAGLFMNTSIINLEETGTGVPLYYGILPLLAIRFVAGRFGTHDETVHISRQALLFSWIILAILSTVTLGHILWTQNSVTAELKQYGARVAFVVFFLLAYLLISSCRLQGQAIRYSKTLLKFLLVYGIYQFFADMYGYTRFLDFLRNSSSFGLRDLEDSIGQGGWSGTYRATSVWTEPSYSALPLGFFLYLLFLHPAEKKERVLWTLVALTYAALTFSRVVWLTMGVLMLSLWIIRVLFSPGRRRRSEEKFRRFKYIFYISFVGFLSAAWPYFTPLYMTDLSSIGRSSSAIIGWRIFADHPVVGSGFNTFPVFERDYSSGLEYYNSEPIVHNLFSGYAQQMGVLGLLYSALPILLVLSLKKNSAEDQAYLAMLFTTLGTFSGDFLYMPLAWLILAIACTRRKDARVRVLASHQHTQPMNVQVRMAYH